MEDGEVPKEEELGVDMVRAAMEGDVKIFEDSNLRDEDFLRKSPFGKNNILHIAFSYGQEDFVKEFLLLRKPVALYKKLATQKNSQGNTPLHVGAGMGRDILVVLNDDDEEEEKLLRVRNSQGNTVLHVALISQNEILALLLLKSDPGLAGIVNNSKEAPLHLAVTHCNFSVPVRELLLKARGVGSWHDAKGLTPLHRAASVGYSPVLFDIVKTIIDICPESTLMCDPSGKSFLHLLSLNLSINRVTIDRLISLKEFRILVNHQDQDGNTPLHLAAKYNNIHMVRSILSLQYSSASVSVNSILSNNDGISARSMIEQHNLLHQLERRTMTEEESSFAKKGDIDSLKERESSSPVIDFLASQDSEGRNFLHLLMNKTAELHLSYSDDHSKVVDFIESALDWFPNLVGQTDQRGNTPVHVLAQNKDLCKTMLADPTLPESSLLSNLLSPFADAIKKNEVDKHDLQPWVKQNADGNTPLHEAIIANNKVMVLQLLSYSQGPASLVNNNQETPLHLLAKSDSSMEKFTVEEIMRMVKANSEAVKLQDKDGHTPMSRAIEAKNIHFVVTLLCNVQESSDDTSSQLQIFLKNLPDKFLGELRENEAFRKMLEQVDKSGKTPLHIAIQEKRFVFVHDLLENWGSEREPLDSKDNQWLMDLLSKPNNVGETPENLLADCSTLPPELEKKLLSDRRTRGIRSSWRIPRTQLQNYMNSMNIIAALQTTITFTAAFTVPGGLNQEIGTPILIWRAAFQVFMISDVIAMCLSMLVLICLLWMVATNQRESVMLQDFALWVLLASFVATLLTFMTGVYVTIYPLRPWIAITTLLLCSLLILLLHRFMLIKLLLFIKYRKVPFVKELRSRCQSADGSNRQNTTVSFGRLKNCCACASSKPAS